MESLETTKSALQALHDGELAGSWSLDPAKSEVRLQSRSMWGLMPVRGVFEQVSGNGVIDAVGGVNGTLTVVAGSINTKSRQRDTHLRSDAFFDVENHQDIVFTVEGIAAAGEKAAVTGTLKVRDQARPVSFEAQVTMAGADELQLEGELAVSRADFGLNWNQLGMASMSNTIIVRAVFVRQPAA